MKTCKPLKSQQIECLFGFHKYTIPILMWGHSNQLLCEGCLRAAYAPNPLRANAAWIEYDTCGRITHYKDSHGYIAQWQYGFFENACISRFTDSEGARLIRPEVPEDRLKL